MVYYCYFLLMLALPSIRLHYKRHVSFMWAWVAPCCCWVTLSGCSTCLCEIASVLTDRVDSLRHCPLLQSQPSFIQYFLLIRPAGLRTAPLCETATSLCREKRREMQRCFEGERVKKTWTEIERMETSVTSSILLWPLIVTTIWARTSALQVFYDLSTIYELQTHIG